MTRNSLHASLRPSARPVWMLLGLIGLLTGGCGDPISPQQKAALAKVQTLGGRVDYQDGGYGVDLIGTGVEDDDLASLKDIANLRRVALKGTRITDQGLHALEQLPNLEMVGIERTLVTREAVDAFRKARPNVQVRY